MIEELVLSRLGHTWLIDLDGSILKHNGYKLDGTDSFLEGAEHFLHSLPPEDMIIFITSRSIETKGKTEEFLKKHRIRYEKIIYDAPYGERILINDNKPSGLKMGYAITLDRDEGMGDFHFKINEAL